MPLINQLIERYKNYRKFELLKPKFYKKYAFIGVGQHSLTNLYPCIDAIGLDLKYICARNIKSAQLLTKRYPNAITTNNINEIANDTEVAGVFISATPNDHFDLVRKFLSCNKNVFVEKPICQTLSELKELLSIETKGECMIGMQLNYSTIGKLLKKKLSNVLSYTYSYQRGAYPEGNTLTELFIHPLNHIDFLFGEYIVENVISNNYQNDITYHINIKHINGIIGHLHLSTHGSWNSPSDELRIICANGIAKVYYPSQILFTPKQKKLANIPLEKLIRLPKSEEIWYNNPLVLPIPQFNPIVENGYMDEIRSFAILTEHRKPKSNINKSSLQQLLTTYKTIELIKDS